MTSAEDGRKISISDVLNGSCDRCLRVNLRPSRSRMKLWMLLKNPALQNGMKTRKKQNCNDHIFKGIGCCRCTSQPQKCVRGAFIGLVKVIVIMVHSYVVCAEL